MSSEFLASFGFSEDPFASTNAANEPLIDRYFVDPPFFPAVVGDPASPKSNVVFAPRGGGKTAQKIMIEKRSLESNQFLCVTYDRFPTENIKQPKEASAEYHLENITRVLLLAVLIEVEDRGYLPEGFDEVDRRVIVGLSKNLLGNISAEKFKESISSIKSIGDKAGDLFRKYGGVVVGLLNVVTAKFGYGKFDAAVNSTKRMDETIRFQFEALLPIVQKFGFKSTYILVDRVDELSITASDAQKTFEFLEPLLIDLPLLETPGVAFKFFLWDQMKEAYLEAGGRPDRLIEYVLDWSVEDLETVLSKRLTTYSGGAIRRFDQILTGDAGYDVHRLISYFAHGSPRDMVRICKKIVDEHTRTGRYGPRIDFKTVKSALIGFSTERAKELYPGIYTDLKKVGELNFTINKLANDVFRVTTQAARSKVQKWQGSGAVVKIGELPNPGNRPQYLYGVVDPRLAVAVTADASLEEALDFFLVICPHCAELRIVEEGDITCPDCQSTFKSSEARTLGAVCSR
ncbi:P-loop ATPase, Sll1717 family [Methylobacterium sp. M6A4_1b]